MAIAPMLVSEVISKARQILGATDPAKGGPDDTAFLGNVAHAMNRFALKAKAMRSAWELSIDANDEYVTLEEEILWPTSVTFVDSDGVRHPMAQVYGEPTPTLTGDRPRVWWLTAVNVPDSAGVSTRAIGVQPTLPVTTPDCLVLEVIQLPQPPVDGTSVPEIAVVLHPYIAFFLAEEMISLYPERIGLLSWIQARQNEGVEEFKRLSSGSVKLDPGNIDVRGYKRMGRSFI
jgi:hypothetical protein